jgi:hypothetical protein
VLAEETVTDPMGELVVGQVVLAGQQPERGGFDDRIPVACFRADRAVAFVVPRLMSISASNRTAPQWQLPTYVLIIAFSCMEIGR